MAIQVVGSSMGDTLEDQLKDSKGLYGQNGYAGPSSDNPGKSTTSGFLPGITQDDLTKALDRVAPHDSRDTVRDASGKGNPPAPKDFKQPKFDAPQTRELTEPTAKEKRVGLAFGMDARSARNR